MAMLEEELQSQLEPALSDADLQTIVRSEIQNGLGQESDSEISGNLTKSMRYYKMELPGDPGEGLSMVISGDVADMVEALLSQVGPAFEQSDLARFPPNNPDDEEQAQQESDACNHVFMEQNDGGTVLHIALKDGFIQRNGIVKTTWEERKTPSYEEYQGLTEIDLMQVLQPRSNNEDVEVLEQESLMVAVETDLGMVEVESFNIKIRRTTTKKGVRCDVIPREEFIVDSDQQSLFLRDARFMAHRMTGETESSLIAMGFDPEQVKALPTYNGSQESDEQARDRSSQESYTGSDNSNHASRNIEIYECYILVDRDGDGLAERRQVFAAGDSYELMKWADGTVADEPYEGVPFASGTPFIMPHRFTGISIFDKVYQVQDTKTSLLRQTLDNAYANNLQRVVLGDSVDLDSYAAPRAWGPIFASDVNDVKPLPVQNITGELLGVLGYMDGVRRERAGPALDMTSEAIPTGNVGNHGVERMMTSLEQMGAMITANYSRTLVKEIYRQIHWLLRQHSEEPLMFQSGENWVEANPQQWPMRERVVINTGLSEGERHQRYTALSKTLELQLLAYDKGGDRILVDLDKIHNTLIDMSRAAKIPTPQQYWLDPESPESQMAIQGQEQQAQQNKQQMDAMQQQLAEAQQQLANAEMVKATTKAENDYLNTRLKEAQAVGKAVESDQNLQFDYAKLAAEVALRLTEMEQNSGTQLNAEVEQNTPETP